MSGGAIGLYARETPGFGDRVAHATGLLQRATLEHAGRIVQATSLGAEDMVVTDLIVRHALPIAIGTLETGKLHAETVALIGTIERRYERRVEVFEPIDTAVVHFVKTHGERAMYESIALRKACCAIRKVEPLARMLEGRRAWVTGMRREQSANRGAVEFSETGSDGRIKLNPLADWSWADVWHYLATFDVPYNPLHDQFYPSIGCAPCTRPVAVGEDFRAGRWWWENEDAKECGLHVKPNSSDALASVDSQRESHGGLVSAQAHFGAAEVKGSTEPGRSQHEDAKECGLHGTAKERGLHVNDESTLTPIGGPA